MTEHKVEETLGPRLRARKKVTCQSATLFWTLYEDEIDFYHLQGHSLLVFVLFSFWYNTQGYQANNVQNLSPKLSYWSKKSLT